MRRYLQARWLTGHVLVLLALLVCLRLAWWQVDRWEATDGTIQNAGYALLWPAFGIGFVVMWLKFLRLELEREDQEAQDHEDALTRMFAEAESLTAGAAPVESVEAVESVGAARTDGRMESADEANALGSGIVGDEDPDDDELNAYNRALAALADKDRRAR